MKSLTMYLISGRVVLFLLFIMCLPEGLPLWHAATLIILVALGGLAAHNHGEHAEYERLRALSFTPMKHLSSEEHGTYVYAVSLWGVKSQIKMALEEMSELDTALWHMLRNRPNNAEEEVADVLIMMGQLRVILDTEKVDRIKAEKLKRLRERCDNA